MTDNELAALQIVDEALGKASRPYIGFSGGKDSLVVADLVHRINPDVDLIYFDDEVIFQELVDYIADWSAARLDKLRIMPGGWGPHAPQGGWCQPWKMAGPLWRSPHGRMEWIHFKGRLPAHVLGYDAVFLGMRRDESERRQRILKDAAPTSTIRGILHVNPIIDWTVDDVWRYIRERELSYCDVYDVLARIGVKPRLQRVGPLALTPGEYLWKGWPELYVRLVRRYGKRWSVPGSRKPVGMDQLTWLDLQEALQ